MANETRRAAAEEVEVETPFRWSTSTSQWESDRHIGRNNPAWQSATGRSHNHRGVDGHGLDYGQSHELSAQPSIQDLWRRCNLRPGIACSNELQTALETLTRGDSKAKVARHQQFR